MNSELKRILNDFLVKVEAYLIDKNKDLDDRLIKSQKLMAQANAAQEEIDKLNVEREKFSQERAYLEKEKELFNEKKQELELKEKQLALKAAKIQQLFQ